VCAAGVVVVSVEGHDVSESLEHSESLGHSESWDMLSPMRHSLSARRYSRIAEENRALHCHPHDKWWTQAPVRQAMELIDGVLHSSLQRFDVMGTVHCGTSASCLQWEIRPCWEYLL
jgi:hypothetical protein